MGTTGTYGLPYQELGDAPDGPALGQNLAQAVENELARIDGKDSNQDTTLTDHGNRLATLETDTADTGWHAIGTTGEPAFQNGWGNVAGQAAVQFRKVGEEVRCRGRIGLNNAPINSNMFTLDPEYAPTAMLIFVVYSGTGGNGFAVLTVNTDGSVMFNTIGTNGNSGQIDLAQLAWFVG